MPVPFVVEVSLSVIPTSEVLPASEDAPDDTHTPGSSVVKPWMFQAPPPERDRRLLQQAAVRPHGEVLVMLRVEVQDWPYYNLSGSVVGRQPAAFALDDRGPQGLALLARLGRAIVVRQAAVGRARRD